jgi:hypothetical protein
LESSGISAGGDYPPLDFPNSRSDARWMRIQRLERGKS